MTSFAKVIASFEPSADFDLRSFSERGSGYSFQSMQIWDDQGELVLSG